MREPPPDFSSRDAWYRIKLLVEENAADLAKGISWDVQARLLRKAFADCTISSSHLTHAMRSGGAQFASAAGCTEDAVRQHGRWCGDRLMERYLTSVTLGPIRALSGFAVGGGDYWLPRTILDPPTTLSTKIFPWVEGKVDAVKSRASNGGESDGAALQFLDMMKYLRVVLLQDAVLLKKLHPSFPLWKLSPFDSAEFSAYAAALEKAIADTPSPFDISITQLVPSLGTALGHVRSELAELGTKIQQIQESSVAQEQQHQQQQFGVMATNMQGIAQLFVAAQQSEARLNAARNAVAESLKALSILSCQLTNTEDTSSAVSASQPLLALSPAQPGLEPSPHPHEDDQTLPADAPRRLALPASSVISTTHAAASPSSSPAAATVATAAVATAAAALGAPVAYTLPTIDSVTALWLEWSVGREGRAGLGGMDEAKDPRLRTSSSVRQQVYRWRKIVTFLLESTSPSATGHRLVSHPCRHHQHLSSSEHLSFALGKGRGINRVCLILSCVVSSRSGVESRLFACLINDLAVFSLWRFWIRHYLSS
ncbi:hypothetical protein V8E36_003389 [Tilletia maclaganii]